MFKFLKSNSYDLKGLTGDQIGLVGLAVTLLLSEAIKNSGGDLAAIDRRVVLGVSQIVQTVNDQMPNLIDNGHAYGVAKKLMHELNLEGMFEEMSTSVKGMRDKGML